MVKPKVNNLQNKWNVMRKEKHKTQVNVNKLVVTDIKEYFGKKYILEKIFYFEFFGSDIVIWKKIGENLLLSLDRAIKL